MFLYRLVEALDSHGVAYAIVGGYAVALHGAVRGTMDIDIVLNISKNNFAAAETALKSLGLQSRLPLKSAEVVEFREEYIKNRNLFAWNFVNSARPAEMVDVILTDDLKKMRIVKMKSGRRLLKVIAIPDLIAMKRRSGRPQDMEDVRALEELGK